MNNYYSQSRSLQRQGAPQHQNRPISEVNPIDKLSNQFSFNSPNTITNQQQTDYSNAMMSGGFEHIDQRVRMSGSLQMNEADLSDLQMHAHQFNHTSSVVHIPQNTSPLRTKSGGRIASQQVGRLNQNRQSQQMNIYEERTPNHMNGSDNDSQVDILNVSKDKLQSRLQAQNDRLRYLDNYRIICEKRIRELAPSHPLPILPSHCGVANPDVEELKQKLNMTLKSLQDGSNSQQNGVDLIKFKSKYDQLVSEKQQLEEILRNETLANEEQRNYIEILKNVIDQKMESLGLGEMISFRNLQGQDPISIYTVLSEVKKEADFWKKETKQMEENFVQQQTTIKQEVDKEKLLQERIEELEANKQQIENESVQLNKDLMELKQLKEESDKEKNDMMDFIEDNTKQLEKINTDHQNNLLRLKTLEQENESYLVLNKQQEQNLKSQEQTLKHQNQQIQDQETQLDKFKDQIRAIKKENEIRQASILEYEKQIEEGCQLATHLKDQLKGKDQDIDKMKQRIYELENETLVLGKDRERVIDEMNLNEKRARIEEESLKKRIKLHEEFAKEQELKCKLTEESLMSEMAVMKQSYETRLEIVTQDKDDFKARFNQSERNQGELRKVKEELLEEIQQLNASLVEGEINLNNKHSQYESQKETLIQCQRDLEQCKQDVIKLEDLYSGEKQRREWLSEEREKLTSALEETRSRLEQEIMHKEVEVRNREHLEHELHEQKEYLSRELSFKTESNTALGRQVDSFKSELNKTVSQLEYTKGLKQDYEQRNNDLTKEYDATSREKKILEKQLKEVRDENQLLFKNEERAKRLIEETEQLKTDIRQRDRDAVLANDKLHKLIGENENYEKEVKRVLRENHEKQMCVDGLEKMKNELSLKHKEMERRFYELHREKQDLEMKAKSAMAQNDNAQAECEQLKKILNSQDDEKVDIIEQMHRLRRQLTDSNIVLERYQKEIEEVEIVSQKIAIKIKSFMDQFLSKLNASEMLQDCISRHTREQSYLLLQNFDNLVIQGDSDDNEKLTNLAKFQTEFNHGTSLLVDIIETLINETMTAKTDFKIIEKKVIQLENRIGSIHTTDVMSSEKTKFLQNELEEQRLQKMKAHQEKNQLKDHDAQSQVLIKELHSQIQTLQKENSFTTDRLISVEQEKERIREEFEQAKASFLNKHVTMKQKEAKLAQASKEKQTLEDLISKIHGIISNYEVQRVIGELSRSIKERFKAENDRISLEEALDKLEGQLNEILRNQREGGDSATKSNSKQMYFTQGQQLRRQINDLECNVLDCDKRISSYKQREKLLEGELKGFDLQAEFENIQKFSRTGPLYENQTCTITSLNRESQELRREVEAKNGRIQELEESLDQREIQYYDQRFKEKQQNDTFNQRGFSQENKGRAQPSALTTQQSQKMLHLQPIKVEDYDFNPEKLQAQTSKQGVHPYQSNNNLVSNENVFKSKNLTSTNQDYSNQYQTNKSSRLLPPSSGQYESNFQKQSSTKNDMFSTLSPSSQIMKGTFYLNEGISSSKENLLPPGAISRGLPSATSRHHTLQKNEGSQNRFRSDQLALNTINVVPQPIATNNRHQKTLSQKEIRNYETPTSQMQGGYSTKNQSTILSKVGVSTPLQSRLSKAFPNK